MQHIGQVLVRLPYCSTTYLRYDHDTQVLSAWNREAGFGSGIEFAACWLRLMGHRFGLGTMDTSEQIFAAAQERRPSIVLDDMKGLRTVRQQGKDLIQEALMPSTERPLALA